jgi:hypothetical protein
MLELLSQLSDEELEEMFRAQEELERKLAEFGPQNDDELHSWIKAELGIDIPRKAVCEHHDPPFIFISDLFFERVDAVLAMANRGGGKTMLVAILHWINSLFKPGCESCTFGATEAQSLRCYAYIKGWIFKDGEKREEVVSSLMRETLFGNASKVEVLPGTPQAVNGPHPQKAHADEIELMDDGTWKESRNMTMSKKLPDGRWIRPQDICTSTRKGPNGRMQKLIDEIKVAIDAGFKPPRKLYQWCVAADTPVDGPRDYRRFPLGTPISQVKIGQLIWTFNTVMEKFELKSVEKVWKSRMCVPVLKLTLDSGEVIRATAEHRFMRRDGSWVELRDLKHGDSLMPLHRDSNRF